jgi:hypothetical protein
LTLVAVSIVFPSKKSPPRCDIPERAAVIRSSTIDGTMDYPAIYSENEAVVSWCGSLFVHLWKQVKPEHPADEWLNGS